MRNWQWQILTIAALVLAACSQGPKGPILVSFADRQRAMIEPAVSGQSYGSIADKLAALPNEVFAGQDVAISETILNNGIPSKGIRVLVRGSAVTDGLLGVPKEAFVKGVFADKKQPDVEKRADFTVDNNGGWLATIPDVAYGSQVDVNIVSKAVRGGDGDVQVMVYPLDKQGSTSVVISHNYKVLDERDPGDIKVPTDDQ